MNLTDRRPRVATRERVYAWKPYLAVLLHVLIRFTPSLGPLVAPQSSQHRSDSSFDPSFDQETVIKAGPVRFQNGTLEL